MKPSSLVFSFIVFSSVPVTALAQSTDGVAPAAAAMLDTPSATPDSGARPSRPDPKLVRKTFYLHGDAGGGYRSFAFAQNDLSLQGEGLSLSGAIGGAVAQNLFLVAEAQFANIVNPTITSGSQTVRAHKLKAAVFGIGPGVVYYFMPSNVSLGASLLLTKASLLQDGVSIAETRAGYGGVLRVGKEWWVSKFETVGVSGQLLRAGMRDTGANADTLVTTAYSVAFAYTY